MAQAAQRVAGSLATKIPQMLKGTTDFAGPKFATFMKYAKVELRPPSASDFGEASKSVNQLVASFRTQKWKQLTVKAGLLNTLVAVEVACWFFVGEVIGKRTLVGYQVPGGTHFDAVV